MAKCRAPRKGVKRPERREEPDDELTELASVLAEASLDDTANAWLKPPWRNGWNAVDLALDASLLLEPLPSNDERDWLVSVCATRDGTHATYWIAQDIQSRSPSLPPLLRAALRCLQVLIANSSGGGEIYNAILLLPLSPLLPERIAHLVLARRCYDAIGTTHMLQGDANDRLRRAFATAWKRGLYFAAYSLPTAKALR